jgi:hypothetical protein
MEPKPKAYTMLGVFFIIAIVGGSIYNIYNESADLQTGLAAIPVPSSLAGVRDASRSLGALVENQLTGKHSVWAAHAWIQERLGKSEMNGFSVIKAPDGRLYRGGLFPLQAKDAELLAGRITDLSDAVQESGGRFFYLGNPAIVQIGAKHLPENMPYQDYNAVLDSFLYELREKNVPFLDARYAFLSHNFPPDSMAGKTSFILGGDAAFALFTYLVDGLEQRFSLVLDPDGFYRDQANYDFERHSGFFIGQLGKETGPAFSGVDDFVAVTPKFESEFAVESLDMFGKSASIEGDATETLLHPDALVYYEDLYSLYPEGYYVHTNATWSKIVNQQNPTGPKALFIYDFQTAQLVSHLAPLFSEMHTLSSHENLPFDALSYIRDNNFDLVIASFFPQNLVLPQTLALVGAGEE